MKTLLLLLLCCLSVIGQGFDDVAFLAAIEDEPAAGGGGGAPVGFDGETVVTNAATGTTLTLAGKTTTGANRCGIVSVQWYNEVDTITSVTWGGVAMTLVTNKLEVTGWSLGTAIYRIVAPATASSSIVITMGSSADIIAVASSYTNVDQTTPVSPANIVGMATTGAVAGPAMVTCPSVSGEMVVDSCAIDQNNTPFTVGAGQTQMGNVGQVNLFGLASREASSGTTVVMSWTHANTSHRALVACSLKAAP